MKFQHKDYDYDEVLNFVCSFWEQNLRSPSIRDVVSGCELTSTSVANYILDSLAEDGKIVFIHDSTARNIIPIEVYEHLKKFYEYENV